ncbi:phosphotransferase [Rhizobium leguminosarum]|nr:phosphotransferase [Rhizobium leguminosarum]
MVDDTHLRSGLEFRRTHSSNNVVSVLAGGSPIYFIKEGPDLERARREIFVYKGFAEKGFSEIAPLMVLCQDETNTLVLKAVQGPTLHEKLISQAGQFENLCTRGAIPLAKLHALSVDRSQVGALSREIPWILSRQEISSRITPSNEAAAEVLGFLAENPMLIRAAEGAKEGWNEEGVIHGDVRLSNLVIDQNESVKLIDWELAGLGPPEYDLGSLMASSIFSAMFFGRTQLASKRNQDLLDETTASYRSVHSSRSISQQMLIDNAAVRFTQYLFEFAQQGRIARSAIGTTMTSAFNYILSMRS